MQQPSLVALGLVLVVLGGVGLWKPSLAYRYHPSFDTVERSDAGIVLDRFGALLLVVLGVWSVSFGW